jgi:CRP-like cAMP-binding protein
VTVTELDRVSLLLRTYLFEDLSPAEIEPLARAARERTLDRGEVLWHVGDPADEVCVIASGEFKDSVVTEDGDEVIATTQWGGGMVIGEPGFFATERNRVLAVSAVAPGRVLLLPRASLEPFLRRHPRVVERALEGLASIARTQTETIAALARRPLRERLLLRLLDLTETNERRADGAGVTPKVSQSTLAAMVGVSRENVNRALAALATEEAIRIGSGRYVIPDADRLRLELSNGPLLVRRNRRAEPSV